MSANSAIGRIQTVAEQLAEPPSEAFMGVPEILIVLLILLVLFGGTQLPKLARSLGQAKKEFRDGVKEASQDESA